jgi:hypothetical protein
LCEKIKRKALKPFCSAVTVTHSVGYIFYETGNVLYIGGICVTERVCNFALNFATSASFVACGAGCDEAVEACGLAGTRGAPDRRQNTCELQQIVHYQTFLNCIHPMNTLSFSTSTDAKIAPVIVAGAVFVGKAAAAGAIGWAVERGLDRAFPRK